MRRATAQAVARSAPRTPLLSSKQRRRGTWYGAVAVLSCAGLWLLWLLPSKPPRTKQAATVEVPGATDAFSGGTRPVRLRPQAPLGFSDATLHFQPLEGDAPWHDVAVWLSGGPKTNAAAGAAQGKLAASGGGSLVPGSRADLEAKYSGPLEILRAHRRDAAMAYRVLGQAGATLIRRSLPEVASVFYPFGGPDIASAMSFFPGAKRYLLVGKDPAAGSSLHLATNLSSGTFAESLDAVASLLRGSDAAQFMRQDAMKRFGESAIGVGMAAPLLAGIGGTGDLRVEALGVLKSTGPGIASGLALDCALEDPRGWRLGQHVAGPGEPLRPLRLRVEYLEADLLAPEGCKAVLAQASQLPQPVALMLKAAAYVLFDAPPAAQGCLRALTSDLGVDVLLQDDSGVPVAWLLPQGGANPVGNGTTSADGDMDRNLAGQVLPGWHVKPFGGYAAGPTTAPYAQPLLQRLYDEGLRNSPWPLGPLRYGYCPIYATDAEVDALRRQGAVGDAIARDMAADKQRQKQQRAAGDRTDPNSSAGICNVIVATRLHGGLTRNKVAWRGHGRSRQRGAAMRSPPARQVF